MENSILRFFAAIDILCLIMVLLSCQSNKEPDLGLIPVKSSDKWQYIDREGKIIINPQFSYAAGFFEGMALIRNIAESPRYGFINENGILIINANYIRATSFSEGLACVVQENGAPTYIDKKGQIKFIMKDAQEAACFNEGLAAFSQFDKDGQLLCGYIDKTGKVKILPQFYGMMNFSEGLAAVMDKNSKWGFIDSTGKVIINYQFTTAGLFKDDLCVVSIDKNWGYIDKTGIYKINPQFDSAFPFSEIGLARVKMNGGKFGFINKSGRIVINPQFEHALGFTKSGRAPVTNGKKWGYIDTEGKFVINPQFEYASCFLGNIAFVESYGKIGLIDKEGRYLINPQYDGINRDVLLGNVTDYYVESDYFDASTILSFILPFTESFNSNTIVRDILGNLKSFKYDISYNRIAVDTTLANKSRFLLHFFSNKNIQSNNYYQKNLIDSGAPIGNFNFAIILPKPKAKVIFENFKSQISAQSSFTLNQEKSNDDQCMFESDSQTWVVCLRNDKKVDVYISIKSRIK